MDYEQKALDALAESWEEQTEIGMGNATARAQVYATLALVGALKDIEATIGTDGTALRKLLVGLPKG